MADLKLKAEVTPQVSRLLIKRRQELLKDLAELERDCFEPPEPTLAGGKLEPVHPNHRPDLAYILDTLCMVKPVLKNEPLREQVEASINGMRYIIQRTREADAAGVAPAAKPWAPHEQGWVEQPAPGVLGKTNPSAWVATALSTKHPAPDAAAPMVASPGVTLLMGGDGKLHPDGVMAVRHESKPLSPTDGGASG